MMPGADEAVTRLRALGTRPGALANFVAPPEGFAPRPLCEEADCLVYAHAEPWFHRVYFAATDPARLARVLAGLPDTRPYLATVLAREGREPQALYAVLDAGGFHRHALFRRIANAKLIPYDRNERHAFAEPGECGALHEKLLRSFDPRIAHFPSAERLREWVLARQALVLRDGDGGLRGFILWHMAGRKAHFNYIANDSGHLSDTFALLCNFYHELAQRGVTAAFGWVDETNLPVLRMHQRFGYQCDGALDLTFFKRPS